MATEGLEPDSVITANALREVMALYAAPKLSFRILPVFDEGTGNYLLMDEGWQNGERIHRVWLHIELRGGKFWIHEDNTEIGIANRLVAAGVPKERIVLAFHEPILRTESGFAAG